MTGSAVGRVSRRIARIAPSATVTVDQRAKALSAQGIAVFNLSAGEPDFPTPPHIIAAARAACDAPASHRYTPTGGHPELRQAIVDATARDTRIDISPGNVLVTNGGKQAVYQALATLLDPGEEVLLPAPYWTTYPEAIRLAGGVTVAVASDASTGYRITTTDLDAAVTRFTKVLLLCSPNNPTGTVYSAAELTEIGEWALRRGVWVVSDEMYGRLTYGPAVFTSILEAVPDLTETTVVINAVSKSYAMTGWRLGWMTGPDDVIRAATNLQSHLSSHVSNISQLAAIAALTGDQEPVAVMRSAFARRRDAVVDALSGVRGVSVPKADGAFYLFLDVRDWLRDQPAVGIGTSTALAEALLDHANTATVPGEAFGAPGHLRLSYAVDDLQLLEGARQIKAFLTNPSLPNSKES